MSGRRPLTHHGSQKSSKSNKKDTKEKVIRVLLDSGSSGDLWFHKKGTPKHFPYSTRLVSKSWNTSNGIFTTKGRGEFSIKFFEYSNSKQVVTKPDVVEYEKDEMKPMFDLILGIQTMHELGIILDCKQKMITIDEITLPMHNIDSLTKSKTRKILAAHTLLSQEPKSTEEATQRVTRILDANYKKADIQAIVKENCSHLTACQQNLLLEVLTKFEPLFDGTLGDWKTKPVSLPVKPGVTPYHGRAYPVPKIHLKVLKRELQRLCDLGVLEWQPSSEWGSPSFIIPKPKNNTVRLLSDFREVNKRIVRKPFPLPKISTVFQEIEGFSFATTLDLNMGYYTIRLDPDASRVCTIIFPWGKYSYKRLPMGIAGSPDIFQEKMADLMATLEFVKTYLDDLLIISTGSLEDHLEKLTEVLSRLQDAGLKINADKSKFCALETEYLGYVISRDGIRPQSNKVQAMLAINPPKNVKELRRFLGMIQYYRDIWAKRSEMLAPLTDLVGKCGQTKTTKAKGTKKAPWHWSEVHQKAFDDAKATIAKEVVLAYPDYSKVFEIYTDASSKQLGSVITQDNRPLAFFSRKLSDTQQRYSVTEIELLAIVETLKEFKGMLWGQQVKVYTDHLNLMRDALGLTSDRVYRWRLLLEEYGPEIVYIKGIHNTVADAISRLEHTPVEHKEPLNVVFANRSEEDEIYPLTIKEIADKQLADRTLQKEKDKYKLNLIENTHVLCKNGKIVIPKSLQTRAVKWYHHYLQHPGNTRLEETLKATMYWTNMRTTVRSHVKNCRSCQINKKQSTKYGKLPTKLVVTAPWEALCVDLIGPYTLRGKDGTEIDFMCLTMIDPASSWFEVVELPVVEYTPTGKSARDATKEKDAYFNKSSAMISTLVDKTWFSRYPRCQHIIYDNGSEFKLHFEALCDSYGIKRKPTSVKNPQANAILERVHQVLMTMLRTAELDMADSVAPSDVDAFLTNAAWAIRSTYHTVLKASPGAAIFGRDMLFDIPLLADWNKIGEYRQHQTDLNTERENKTRVDYDYKVGDKVLVRKDGILRKTESRYQSDPWTITTVHTYGTIRVQRGSKSERLNIRRVIPFFETTK